MAVYFNYYVLSLQKVALQTAIRLSSCLSVCMYRARTYLGKENSGMPKIDEKVRVTDGADA